MGISPNDFVFTLADVIKITVAAFAVGGFYVTVRRQGKDIVDLKTSVDKIHKASIKRHEILESHFLHAIQELGKNIQELTLELRERLAITDTRLDSIEGKN